MSLHICRTRGSTTVRIMQDGLLAGLIEPDRRGSLQFTPVRNLPFSFTERELMRIARFMRRSSRCSPRTTAAAS